MYEQTTLTSFSTHFFPKETLGSVILQAVRNKPTNNIGLIAQELEKILPECVNTSSTGVKTVDSDNLTWYLINAVKELSAEVQALKAA